MPQINTERLIATAEVAADLRDALEVVDELDPPEDLRGAVFTFAAQLTTRRAVMQGGSRLPTPGELEQLHRDAGRGLH